jgi:hypothetical protein
MKTTILIGIALSLLCGCASQIATLPDGSIVSRHKLATNTGVELTATGAAAEKIAARLNVPKAPSDWNNGGDPAAPVQPTKLAASAPAQSSYLHLIVGENQSKGFAWGVTGWMTKVLAEAWESVQHASEMTTRHVSTEATKQAATSAATTQSAISAGATAIPK